MAGHTGKSKWSEGKQEAKIMHRACEDIDEYAAEIDDPKEKEDYLALIAGVRAELRMLDRQRSRRSHALEDAEVCGMSG